MKKPDPSQATDMVHRRSLKMSLGEKMALFVDRMERTSHFRTTAFSAKRHFQGAGQASRNGLVMWRRETWPRRLYKSTVALDSP